MARALSSASWLLTGGLLLAVAGLGGLGFVTAGNPTGWFALPDAATGSTVEVLRDPGARLTRDAVLAQPDSGWKTWTGETDYVHCERGEAVWVRITLHNPTPLVQHGILAEAELHTDRLDFWTHDADAPDGWRHARAGEWTPPVEKSLWGRDSAFFVRVPARGKQVSWLRVEDHFGVWFKPVWWPDERAFLAAQLRTTMAESLYFGVILALFIYNGVLWLRLRHRDLGYYLGHLAGVGTFMFLARSVAPLLGVALGSPVMEIFFTVAIGVGTVFQILFAREFLNLPALAPRLDRVARILAWGMALIGVGGLAFPWLPNTTLIHVGVAGVAVCHAVLFLGGCLAWRAGALHARYFLLSFGCFFLGNVPLIFNWLLAIPVGASPLAMLLGSALEMLLLSVALADRFARLQHERHVAQLAEEGTRLEMLRYQLNPHFLFNALNSIYGLVLPHSRPAGDLVRRLADFCRGTLTRPHDRWSPLGEELAMLRGYLAIEEARWHDSLTIAFELDPAADAFLLPPFLLLPFLDNAIKHGAATGPELLAVRLTSRRAPDGSVTLTFANTGTWATPAPAQSTGTGLTNIRARLDRCFPAAHTLTIDTCAGWVIVTLRLAPHENRESKIAYA